MEELVPVLISREELHHKVWTEPMLKVGKVFGVSSSYLARVCTRMNVPRPERGYWAKLAVGKSVQKEELPPARPDDLLAWGRGVDLSSARRRLPDAPAQPRRRKKTSTPPQDQQHSLLRGAKGYFEVGRTGYSHKYLKPAKRNLVDLVVTKTGLDRALSFANVLFWELEQREYRVMLAPAHERFGRDTVMPHEIPRQENHLNLWVPGRITVVYIGTLAVGLTIIEMSEQSDGQYLDGDYVRVDPKTAERLRARGMDSWRISRHDFPTGRLRVLAYCPYRVADWTLEWCEAKAEDLNRRVGKIVNEIVGAVPTVVNLVTEGQRQAELDRQRREEEWREWQRQRDLQRAAEAREKSRQQFLAFVADWTETKKLHEFFVQLQAELAALEGESADHLRSRAALAEKLIGPVDALRLLQNWETPEELLAAK